jgi:hypothetical protein
MVHSKIFNLHCAWSNCVAQDYYDYSLDTKKNYINFGAIAIYCTDGFCDYREFASNIFEITCCHNLRKIRNFGSFTENYRFIDQLKFVIQDHLIYVCDMQSWHIANYLKILPHQVIFTPGILGTLDHSGISQEDPYLLSITYIVNRHLRELYNLF